MRTIRIAFLMMSAIMLFSTARAWAEESAPQPKAEAPKISVSVRVEPNEVRTYDLSLKMTGKLPTDDSAKPVDVDASYSMKLRHEFGRREDDGLLPLEISAANGQATIGGEKLALPTSDFPKLTLLIDRNWKIVNMFGLAGTRYAHGVPGLNYSDLIMLFFIPNGSTPHAVGESWSSKIKLPGMSDECSVKTTLKSVGSDGTVTVDQDYSWPQQKTGDGSLTTSKATAESVFLLDSGKMLKSHVDSEVIFTKSSAGKQDQEIGRANTKIDISLAKNN